MHNAGAQCEEAAADHFTIWRLEDEQLQHRSEALCQFSEVRGIEKIRLLCLDPAHCLVIEGDEFRQVALLLIERTSGTQARQAVDAVLGRTVVLRTLLDRRHRQIERHSHTAELMIAKTVQQHGLLRQQRMQP